MRFTFLDNAHAVLVSDLENSVSSEVLKHASLATDVQSGQKCTDASLATGKQNPPDGEFISRVLSDGDVLLQTFRKTCSSRICPPQTDPLKPVQRMHMLTQMQHVFSTSSSAQATTTQSMTGMQKVLRIRYTSAVYICHGAQVPDAFMAALAPWALFQGGLLICKLPIPRQCQS